MTPRSPSARGTTLRNRSGRRPRARTPTTTSPAALVAHDARPAVRFAHSYRDAAGLLPERGANIAHETILTGAPFSGYRYPPDAIALAVRRYLRFRLSYADVAELLAERGVGVDPSTIFARVRAFARSTRTRRATAVVSPATAGAWTRPARRSSAGLPAIFRPSTGGDRRSTSR